MDPTFQRFVVYDVMCKMEEENRRKCDWYGG